jgi:hypothetical protein
VPLSRIVTAATTGFCLFFNAISGFRFLPSIYQLLSGITKHLLVFYLHFSIYFAYLSPSILWILPKFFSQLSPDHHVSVTNYPFVTIQLFTAKFSTHASLLGLHYCWADWQVSERALSLKRDVLWQEQYNQQHNGYRRHTHDHFTGTV